MPLKIRGSEDTEIYISDSGYVAIKQTDRIGNDDSIVIFTAEQLPIVINELQRLHSTRKEWEEPAIEIDYAGKPTGKLPS